MAQLGRRLCGPFAVPTLTRRLLACVRCVRTMYVYPLISSMKRYNVFLDEAQVEALRTIAKKQPAGVKVAHLIRAAINNFIRPHSN
jgi:hypothetical protein